MLNLDKLIEDFRDALFKAQASGLGKKAPTLQSVTHAIEILTERYGRYRDQTTTTATALIVARRLKKALEG